MHARRMVVAVVALCTLFVSVWMLPDATASEGPREPKLLAEMAVGTSRVDWQPARDYEHITLTVAGPAGLWVRKEFATGQPASLSLIDQNGKALPEGAYTYELRLVSRKEGDLPERSLLQAGTFAVRDGSFAAVFEEIDQSTRNAPEATRVHHGEVVTAANECLGPLCVAGDDAGPPILRLKGSSGVGILFNDIPDAFSHSRDWLLQANPNPFTGGLQHFFLQDVDAGTIPFTVQGQAPDYSLVVGGDSVVGSTGGNIGVGTALPAKAVHVARTDTPTLRLEDTYTGTFPGIRIWDIGANSTELFVKDVTGSSSMPFRIKAGASSDSLVITGGSVGVGTSSPSSRLHVNGGDIRVSGGAFIDDGVTLNAPDYVFEPSYSLMPLAELREFVAREKHLPNVPAAADIKKEGLNLSQFQMRLLEKIEELALYTLQQEEGLQSLRDENLELKTRLEALENAQARADLE